MGSGDVSTAAIFQTALALILSLEGGCVDHPADPGGATCYGITQSVYDAWRHEQGKQPQPVSRITQEEVTLIYRIHYWEPSGAARWAELGHPGVALYVFDAAVQHGVAGSRRLIGDVEKTLRDHPLLGLAQLHAERMDYYTRLNHWETFGRGWTRRISTVYRRAMELEHPDGLLRVDRLNLNGTEWDVGIARIVRERIWARGVRMVAQPCSWWRRLFGGCSDEKSV